MEAAEASGARRITIAWRHVVPNVAPPLVVYSTALIGLSIIYAAGLSFLGIGVQPPHPSWGGMLSEARREMTHAWWMCAFPGAAIALTVLAFNLLGDGLRDALDPKT